jgi:hypothetical protein
MPGIRQEIIEQIKNVKEVGELWCFLQNAIELEHATIPSYMTALYSIKQGMNRVASEIIRSVIIEEMLHMSIACNVLNAIGGCPSINHEGFIPDYPTPLPMGIGEDRELCVTLAPLSKTQLLDVFMAIEEPDDPLLFPVKPELLGKMSQEEYSTIGDFYQAIIDKINELGNKIFIGNPARQMVNSQWFPETELWPVTDVNTATTALELIVSQGEGTNTSPLDPECELAHYYRFAEIYYGRRLVKDPSEPLGWSYSGEHVPLDEENGIYNLMKNASTADYEPGSVARRYADQTNYTYSSLLNALHQTFNGQPQLIDQAMGIMYELRLTVQKMVTIPVGTTGQFAAPPFEYVGVNE